MKDTRTIEVTAKDVETIIKDLSLVVVSMDRIGAAYHDNLDKRTVEAYRFMSNSEAFKRLAQARAILSEAYNLQSDEGEVEKLEDDADNMPYWRPSSDEENK